MTVVSHYHLSVISTALRVLTTQRNQCRTPEISNRQLCKQIESSSSPDTAKENVHSEQHSRNRTRKSTAIQSAPKLWDAPSGCRSWSSTLNPARNPGPVLDVARFPLLPRPEVYVDASNWGIGFIFGEHWLAWKFNETNVHIPLNGGNRGVDMSWSELIAVELGVLTLVAAGYRDTTIRIRSDNSGVVSAIERRSWGKKERFNMILTRIFRYCEMFGLALVIAWVPSDSNPADGPSRGRFPTMDLMLDRLPSLPTYLNDIVHLVGRPMDDKVGPIPKPYRRQDETKTNITLSAEVEV